MTIRSTCITGTSGPQDGKFCLLAGQRDKLVFPRNRIESIFLPVLFGLFNSLSGTRNEVPPEMPLALVFSTDDHDMTFLDGLKTDGNSGARYSQQAASQLLSVDKDRA